MAMLVLACVLPMACSAPSFEGGQSEAVADLVAPGFEATVNLELPAGYFVNNVTMNVTGMAAPGNSSAYPEGVQLRVNDSLIWDFNGTGYGPLGRQDVFSTGSNEAKTEFGTEGGINKLWMRLPKDAIVQSATMGLRGAPLIKIEQIANFTGEGASDSLGFSVSSAGDVNNDGYDDVIVGAYCNNASGDYTGRAYIFFGGPAMDNIPDVTFTGEAAGDDFGWSVSGAGDVNKDGYDDVIVGAQYAGIAKPGRAYLFFGGPNMDNLADVTFTGAFPDDNFGLSVSGAGDVNKDGYDDVIVGAWNNNAGGSHAGRAYLYYGGASVDNGADVTFTGAAANDLFGYSVSDAGDVNKDGYGDVIIGALGYPGGGYIGRTCIYYGGASMDSTADVVLTGAAGGDNFGRSVSGAGDVNNDGYDDVIIGADGDDTGVSNGGGAHIYYGGASMDNVSDVNLTGAATLDVFGFSVSGAGDVDNDGFDDVVVGAYQVDDGGDNAGGAYLYLGGANMDSSADAAFAGGSADDHLGWSVSGAGDMNKDGYDEIIIGAPDAASGGSRPGMAYIYTLHNSSISGILDPGLRLGSTTIWSATGQFNGTAVLTDFAKTLNDYLRAASPSGTDASGNSYVDVHFDASAKSGGSLSLFNLSIVYQYSTTVPDFASSLDGYLEAHQGDQDGSGNIAVPVTVRSQSPGRVKLSDLKVLRDMPPFFGKPIGPLELDEDTAIVPFLDLNQYFQNDYGPYDELDYSVVSSTNSTQVRLWITANRYLSVDAMTGDANDNWTGTVEAVVACSDHWNQKTESNRFTIVIRNVNDPPIITSTPMTAATAGIPYFYNVTAYDGDNDPLHFSLSTSPVNMTIDSVTGKIQWMPRARGNHPVGVSVTDGNATVEQNFSINVPNIPPRITSTPPLKATVGVPYVHHITAEDDNGDPLSFYLSGDIAQFDTLTPDNVINFTPTQPASLVGSISVSDGLAKVYQNFTITVAAGAGANRAPQFNSTPITTATIDTHYFYNATAVDPDQDALTFSLESGPTGMTVEPSTGKITWTPSAAGNFTVVLKVSDGKGAEAKQEFVIKVPEAVRPLVVLVSPQPGASLKGTIKFSGTVTKGTRNVIQVQIRIDGKEWKDAVGTDTWAYKMNTKTLKNGKHTFEFRAYDGKEYGDVQTVEFKFDNPAAGKGFILMMDGWIALTLLAVAGAVSVLRRR
jgi:hypothetical protein